MINPRADTFLWEEQSWLFIAQGAAVNVSSAWGEGPLECLPTTLGLGFGHPAQPGTIQSEDRKSRSGSGFSQPPS